MNKLRINHAPADEYLLFRRQVTSEGFIYHPIAFQEYKDRIQHAYDSQDFDPVFHVLVRTAEEPHVRYYPLPKLLDKGFIRWFAEDAYQRIMATITEAKVDTRIQPSTSALSKLATKITKFFGG